MCRRDWDLAAEDSLCDNYIELARSATAQAAIDYIATRYPQTAADYLKQWMYNVHGNRSTHPSRKKLIQFANQERKALIEYFGNCGSDIAEMVNRKEYVRMALHGEPSSKVLRNITAVRRQNHRYFDTRSAKQKDAPPERHCLDCDTVLRAPNSVRCRHHARLHSEQLRRTAKFAVAKSAKPESSEYNE